jgi:hypothetical protein
MKLGHQGEATGSPVLGSALVKGFTYLTSVVLVAVAIGAGVLRATSLPDAKAVSP